MYVLGLEFNGFTLNGARCRFQGLGFKGASLIKFEEQNQSEGRGI